MLNFKFKFKPQIVKPIETNLMKYPRFTNKLISHKPWPLDDKNIFISVKPQREKNCLIMTTTVNAAYKNI